MKIKTVFAARNAELAEKEQGEANTIKAPIPGVIRDFDGRF